MPDERQKSLLSEIRTKPPKIKAVISHGFDEHSQLLGVLPAPVRPEQRQHHPAALQLHRETAAQNRKQEQHQHRSSCPPLHQPPDRAGEPAGAAGRAVPRAHAPPLAEHLYCQHCAQRSAHRRSLCGEHLHVGSAHSAAQPAPLAPA